ncbi:hypothetical protein ACEPAF_7342 [Sanghuangporus sanghuang]
MDHQDAVDRLNSVPMSVAERVINVHTTKSFEWVVDNIFNEEKCGKRNKVLFWKSDKPGSCHFFIEFAQKDSIPIAQKEAGPGVTVHCLSRNMNMAYVFDCLSRGIDPPKKRAQPDTEGSQAGDPPNSAKYSISSTTSAKRQRILENEPTRRPSPPPSYRDAPHKPYRPTTNFSQNPRDTAPRDVPPRDASQRSYAYESKPKQNWNTSADNRDSNRRYQSGYSSNYQKSRFRNNDFRSSNGSVSPPRRPKDESLYYGDRDDERGRSRERDFNPTRSSFRRSSDTSMKRPSETSLKRPSDVAMSTSNDSYIPTSRPPVPPQPPSKDAFDLTNLDSLSDDNISAVIDSLKSSFSGPESWMTVAAHYRRKELQMNALAVVDSMLEVMRERGMEKSDLRPALLLMAQCHYSIAKQEMHEPDSKESSSRHFVLLLDWLRETYGPFTPVLDAIAQSANRNPWSSQKEGASSYPQAPYDSAQRPVVSGYDSVLPLSSSLFDSHSSVPARIDAISEENKRLRESRSATSAELAACRTALHEAENQARLTEVKLQRALEDHRLAAASAVRESDARRRAEDRLIQDRKAWERRTEELRDEGARSAMRELTAILTLSARAPLSMLEATRVFCEARGRVERDVPNTA